MSEQQGSTPAPAPSEGRSSGPTDVRSALGGWLEGPRAVTGEDLGYRGERLGLPESGPGSVAGFGRRILALLLDWIPSSLVASALFRPERGSLEAALVPWLVFLLEVVVLTWLTGASFGQRLLRLRVATMDGRPLGPARSLLRGVLLGLLVPAVVYDRDGRGLHDKAARTVVLRG
ncbi:MAG: RDD family protein [Motilibacteraceae bacterium]